MKIKIKIKIQLFIFIMKMKNKMKNNHVRWGNIYPGTAIFSYTSGKWEKLSFNLNFKFDIKN